MKKGNAWRHLALGILIATVSLYLTYRKTNGRELLEALEEINWPVLFMVLPPLALSYVFRAVRWRKLLEPVGKVSAGDVAGPLITGFFVNTLLPGRVGEILRVLLLSRKTGISRGSSFATVILARLFDGLTLAAMSLLVMGVFWERLNMTVRMGLAAAGFMYVLLLAGLVFLRSHHDSAAGILSFPVRLMGFKTIAGGLERMMRSFAEGLGVLKNARDAAVVGLYSALIWGCLILSVVPVFLAMHLSFTWYHPVLILVLAGLGMLVPTPAGMGTVHGALVLVLPGLGVLGVDDAKVLALLFHSTQFLPVIAVGLFVGIREGVTAAQVERIAEEGEEMVRPPGG